MFDARILGLVLLAFATITVFLQLMKLFLLGYDHGYYPRTLHLDESREVSLYASPVIQEIQSKVQNVVFNLIKEFRNKIKQKDIPDLSERLEDELNLVFDIYFTPAIFKHYDTRLREEIHDTARSVSDLISHMSFTKTSPGAIRHQALYIASSLVPDIVRLLTEDQVLRDKFDKYTAPLFSHRFQDSYAATYRAAVSALANAMVLGTIGFVIYKLG